MGERRGVATAGTWCVDFNKSIADWPAEDTTNEVLAVDRQGGGSACNMAIDLKRLDPAFPVETMGVVGDDDDARFLFAQCDAFGVERQGLVSLPGGATMSVDAFNVLSTGRRTHFYHQGVAALLSPEHFDFSGSCSCLLPVGLPGARARAFCMSVCPALTFAWMRRGAPTPTAGSRRCAPRADAASPPTSS
jgi:sugar/nucleoside kinase (ribokinase family)